MTDIYIEDILPVLLDPYQIKIQKAFGPFLSVYARPFKNLSSTSTWCTTSCMEIDMYTQKMLVKLSSQAMRCGNRYTEKQQQYLLKAIHRYRRQLNMKFNLPNIEELVKNPNWKFAARPLCIDNCYQIEYIANNNCFHLTFPYEKYLLATFKQMYATGKLPAIIEWDHQNKIWVIGNTNAGRELIRRSVAYFKINFEKDFIMTKDTADQLSIIDSVKYQSVVTIKNNEIELICINKKQKILAENVLAKNVNLYQKLSWLAFLNFTFDESVHKLLRKQHRFKNWQIHILLNRYIELNCKGITQKRVYVFLNKIQLGMTCEFTTNSENSAEFYKQMWGKNYLGDVHRLTAINSKFDSEGNYLLRGSKPPIVDVLLQYNINDQIIFSRSAMPVIGMQHSDLSGNNMIPLLITKYSKNDEDERLINQVRHNDLNYFIKILVLTNEKNNFKYSK